MHLRGQTRGSRALAYIGTLSAAYIGTHTEGVNLSATKLEVLELKLQDIEPKMI